MNNRKRKPRKKKLTKRQYLDKWFAGVSKYHKAQLKKLRS